VGFRTKPPWARSPDATASPSTWRRCRTSSLDTVSLRLFDPGATQPMKSARHRRPTLRKQDPQSTPKNVGTVALATVPTCRDGGRHRVIGHGSVPLRAAFACSAGCFQVVTAQRQAANPSSASRPHPGACHGIAVSSPDSCLLGRQGSRSCNRSGRPIRTLCCIGIRATRSTGDRGRR